MTNHDQGVTFETIQPDGYSLTYTCFLLPHDPSYELTEVLSEQLTVWLQEICLLNNWKLEYVTIRPQYLQWALSVSPSVATVQIVQQVRTLTTRWLEEATGDHPTPQDLWAPGYLALQGVHHYSEPIIERYICLVRMQQT